jgi:hypothetical protein
MTSPAEPLDPQPARTLLAGWRPDPANAFRAVIGGGLLLMLAANMPGQLSYDSIVELHEGHHHIRETWAPAFYSAVLAAADAIVPGTGLYLVGSALLLCSALLALRRLRPGTSWAGPIVALPLMLLPGILLTQGDIWKDVLFANLTIAAFVVQAHVAKVWPGTTPGRGRPWLALIGIVVMLAAAGQARQNGLIAAVAAALAMAWIVRAGGWRAMLGWAAGGLVLVVLLSHLIGVWSLPRSAPQGEGRDKGLMVLQRYDLVGAMAHDPKLRLDDIRAADPQAEAMIRTRGVPLYSPERVDYMSQDPAVGAMLTRLPRGAVAKQWTQLLLRHPVPYLAHRWDAFVWVLATPDIDSCLPVYVGVDGPLDLVKDLRMVEGVTPPAQFLYNYASHFLDTPACNHVTYLVAALAVMVLLLMRREGPDIAMAALMLAALGFTASFFVISIACDYRYLYLLDLAAITGLIYLALDPPLKQLRLRK